MSTRKAAQFTMLMGSIATFSLGVGDVKCEPCARALLPAPLNWESYTFTTTAGDAWTWDVAFARAVVSRRLARSSAPVLERTKLATFLAQHGQVVEEHLDHIPPDRIDEPVLVAPLPNGQGHVLIDGSHRATLRLRLGLEVLGVVLTPVESTLAIDVAPLAMRRVYEVLRQRNLLPHDPQR
jgi:hypothetical protein